MAKSQVVERILAEADANLRRCKVAEKADALRDAMDAERKRPKERPTMPPRWVMDELADAKLEGRRPRC